MCLLHLLLHPRHRLCPWVVRVCSFWHRVCCFLSVPLLCLCRWVVVPHLSLSTASSLSLGCPG